MQTSLTLAGAAGLFTAMAVLAAVPSVSVMAVVARSASHGFVHGALTALGIVVGDIVFILLAIFGLVLLVETLGEFFVLVKIAGIAYLLWLGIVLWRSGVGAEGGRGDTGAGGLSSFMTGLLITLADQKAILFYLGFLPAFADLAAMTFVDTGLLVMIAVASVGGVKLVYAAAADRIGCHADRRGSVWISRTAALVLIGSALLLAARIG